MLKQFPNPMVGLPTSRWLFLATVVISLGLHGALLSVPLAENSVEPEEPEVIEEDNKVKVLSLADEPLGEGKSEPLTQPKTTLPPAPQPQKSSPTRRTTSTITPAKSKTPAISPTPRQSPQNTQTPSTDDTTTGGNQTQGGGTQGATGGGTATGGSGVSDTFPDLPEYPGALVGSAGFFWQQSKAEAEQSSRNTTDAIAQVAQFYKTEAPKQKVEITSKFQDTDFQVYELASGNHAPRFLHLVRHSSKTVILVRPEQMTLAELQDQTRLAQMSPQEQKLEELLAGLSTTELDINQVAGEISKVGGDPNNFQTRGTLPAANAITLFENALRDENFVPGSLGREGLYMVQHPDDDRIAVNVYLLPIGNGEVGVVSSMS